jgi:SnoaL-like protein
MAIHLPKPIDIYFASENAHDTTALDKCFAADAIVRDEGKTIEGLAAIKAWRIGTAKKYDHTVEPVAIAERDGKVIVTGKVSGNFPGSPVNLDHAFEIEGERIVSLEIG